MGILRVIGEELRAEVLSPTPAGAFIWLAFWALVFGDRLLSDPLVLGWTVLLFGTLGGLSWWEIIYGKDARKERERARRRSD